MNENCKYCDYVSKCSRVIEYNSVMCKLHRSFPKVVDLSYEELEEYNKKLINILKELRSWLEEEKNRLARECSQIYEDSLGKTRLVNEDIFNEVHRIISKLNELEGKNE